MMQITNPVKAIRANCLQCMNGSSKEVKLCTLEDACPLWPFRFGKNPFRKTRELTEEEKERRRNNLQKVREKMGDNYAGRGDTD